MDSSRLLRKLHHSRPALQVAASADRLNDERFAVVPVVILGGRPFAVGAGLEFWRLKQPLFDRLMDGTMGATFQLDPQVEAWGAMLGVVVPPGYLSSAGDTGWRASHLSLLCLREIAAQLVDGRAARVACDPVADLRQGRFRYSRSGMHGA